MQAPQKIRDATTEPFWSGLLQGTLRLPKCRECGHLLFPIGPCCSNCLSTEPDWVELSGKGQVWSYIVYHHAFDPAFADKLPYNVALVLLDEGPRLLTNIVGIDNAQISNGMRVTAQFDQVAEDSALLRFRPDDTA
jgi:uncharacterized OB-fold protein